jgi:hypothetical protein
MAQTGNAVWTKKVESGGMSQAPGRAGLIANRPRRLGIKSLSQQLETVRRLGDCPNGLLP